MSSVMVQVFVILYMAFGVVNRRALPFSPFIFMRGTIWYVSG